MLCNVLLAGWLPRKVLMLPCSSQDLQHRTGSAEDVRVLRALWNIFDALRAPREDLPESLPPGSRSPTLANGAFP